MTNSRWQPFGAVMRSRIPGTRPKPGSRRIERGYMDMDTLKCTVCGEMVDNYMFELEKHLTGHNIEFDENDMQDVLEYFDSVED